MRALITGAGGFVGPYLANELIRAGIECFGTVYEDTANSIAGMSTTSVDVRNRAALAQYVTRVAPDYLVHLAAISDIQSNRSNPSAAFEVNLGGTVNLLESVRALRSRPRVLIVSSGAVYGSRSSGEKGFTEEDPLHPVSTYAASKLMAEEAARCYARDFGIDIVIARSFNHTGPGQSPEFVCSGFARQIADASVRSGTIAVQTGYLDARRDFSDVRDIVAAYVSLLKKGRPGEVYNVCSGTLATIREVLAMLGQSAGLQVRSEVDPSKLRSHEVEVLGGNATKIRRETGWVPQIPLRTTLRDLLDYWRQRARVAA